MLHAPTSGYAFERLTWIAHERLCRVLHFIVIVERNVVENGYSHVALLRWRGSDGPEAYFTVHACSHHHWVGWQELDCCDLATGLGMTLANSKQLRELVVPHSDFSDFSARCNQAQMVTELDRSYSAFVGTPYISELLWWIVGLFVHFVALLVSIDYLLHLIFPNKDHVDNLTLRRVSFELSCWLVCHFIW